ncbi:Hypothetical predicted protein [Octopus vulgaris]|uniref:Uncharacterized protein n=2 Tax=Octopus TaxID=6643 RepID=A0AA36B0K6_OCTVU|nr:transmembrane protein 59 [Octopus sinensis]CAI9725731.1 Hypothetical predicted protein [Octopus vulgaris]
MALNARFHLLIFSVFFVALTQANFGQFFDDVTSCLNVCSKNFSSNEKNLNACRRGCRLFYVCKLSHNNQRLNDTNMECFNVCHEAYANITAEKSACRHGCSSALPLAEQREKEKDEESEPRIHLLYPLMYVHGLYSNMIHRVYRQMSISWSFYMQGDNGNLIVMRSKPKVYVEYRGFDSDGDEYRTSNYLETNIESGNNVATPQLKNSQLHAVNNQNGDDDEELNISLHDVNGQNADWLACLSLKFGLPRILLTALVLFCAVVMIWLCLTAAVTAPEHRIPASPPKLSIYGDLDYLVDFEQKKMKKCLPQDIVVAAPLPVNIKSDRI